MMPTFLLVGWFDMDTMMTFKRLISLTQDPSVVLTALAKSPRDLLQASDYRSRQYYKSKGLYNTGAIRFSTAHCFQTIVFIQTRKECRSPIHKASFDSLKIQIGQFLIPQSTFDF